MDGNGRLESMSEAVRFVINSALPGIPFYGNDLKKAVVSIYPEAKDMYVDTIMRMMRRHCRGKVICVDRNKSLYERI